MNSATSTRQGLKPLSTTFPELGAPHLPRGCNRLVESGRYRRGTQNFSHEVDTAQRNFPIDGIQEWRSLQRTCDLLGRLGLLFCPHCQKFHTQYISLLGAGDELPSYMGPKGGSRSQEEALVARKALSADVVLYCSIASSV